MLSSTHLDKEQLLARARFVEELAGNVCQFGYGYGGNNGCDPDQPNACASCQAKWFLEKEHEKANTAERDKEMDDLV